MLESRGIELRLQFLVAGVMSLRSAAQSLEP